MRKAIARRLTESKSSVPHFYLVADCRVDALLELRRQVNEASRRKISVRFEPAGVEFKRWLEAQPEPDYIGGAR